MQFPVSVSDKIIVYEFVCNFMIAKCISPY